MHLTMACSRGPSVYPLSASLNRRSLPRGRSLPSAPREGNNVAVTTFYNPDETCVTRHVFRNKLQLTNKCIAPKPCSMPAAWLLG
jgi:hypothetical protein